MENIYIKKKNEIIKILDISEEVLSNLKIEYDTKKDTLNNYHFSLYILIIFVLVIISSILSIFLKFKTTLKSNYKFDFILFSCTDIIFRTKHIDVIADGLNYAIYYIPNFHIRSLIRYYEYFKSNKTSKVYFGILTFKDYFNFLFSFIKKYKLIRSLKDQNTKHNTNFAKKQIINYLLYSTFSENHFKNYNNNSTKLLFEHQKFYFLPVIDYFKNKNFRTIHFQHGAMFHKTSDYIPLFTDETTCCSMREHNIYIQSGVNNDKIHILGAPLQKIINLLPVLSNKETSSLFDIIILLPRVSEQKNIKHYIQILKYLNEFHSNKEILLRFRPRTKNKDLSLLKAYLFNFKISSNNSLADDLWKSNKIITFSIDSIYEILKLNKKFVFINLSYDIDTLLASKAVSYNENIKEILDNFIINDLLDEKYLFSKKEQTDLIGEIDISYIKNKFKQIILT